MRKKTTSPEKQTKALSPAVATERFSLADVLIYVFLGLIVLTILIPFANIVALSLSDYSSAIADKTMLFPGGFNLKAYSIMFNEEFYRSFLLTLVVTVANTALHLILCMMAAYPLSHANLPGRKVMLFFILFAMLFNGGTIPFYMLIRDLNLTDNILVYILPGVVAPFTVILMKNFINQIPKSLEEAALMDGANYAQVLFKIIFPLSKPIMATMGLFNAVGVWNNWFSAILFVKDKKLYLIQNVLRELIIKDNLGAMGQASESSAEISIQMAAIVITILPILLLYAFLQRYFMKGITLGSVKE